MIASSSPEKFSEKTLFSLGVSDETIRNSSIMRSIKTVLPEPFSLVRKKKFETLTFYVAAKESLTFPKISSNMFEHRNASCSGALFDE